MAAKLEFKEFPTPAGTLTPASLVIRWLKRRPASDVVGMPEALEKGQCFQFAFLSLCVGASAGAISLYLEFMAIPSPIQFGLFWYNMDSPSIDPRPRYLEGSYRQWVKTGAFAENCTSICCP